MLPQRGHRTRSPCASGRAPSAGGFGGSVFVMANASSIAHRLPTKTGQLQSFRCRTQTKYASAAAAQALLHRSRPGSTPSRHSGASPERARSCSADNEPGDAGNREDWPASPVRTLSTQCESPRGKSCRLTRWRLSSPFADGRPGSVMTRRLTARHKSPNNRRGIAERMTGINFSRSLETRL